MHEVADWLPTRAKAKLIVPLVEGALLSFIYSCTRCRGTSWLRQAALTTAGSCSVFSFFCRLESISGQGWIRCSLSVDFSELVQPTEVGRTLLLSHTIVFMCFFPAQSLLIPAMSTQMSRLFLHLESNASTICQAELLHTLSQYEIRIEMAPC